MAYIGNSPAGVGNYQVVDDISSTFNGVLTSFALTASSLAINPAKSGQLLVSINGVLQEPDDTGTEGFKVSGSNIVFSSAPATGSTFWAVWQGQAVDIGTPSDGVVGTAQLSATGTKSGTTYLAGDNTWKTVVTDLVNDTTPQLGGNLDTSTFTVDGVDISTRDGVLTSTTTTANAALPKAGGTMTGILKTTGVKIGSSEHYLYQTDADTLAFRVGDSPYDYIKFKEESGSGGSIDAAGGDLEIKRAGVTKLATTSTGVDVTGSVTCDGFTSTGIDDNATTELLQLDATNSIVRVGDVLNTANTQLHFRQSAIDGTHYIISYANTKHLAIKNQDAAGDLYFSAGGAERMRIDSAGIVTTPYQPAFSAYLSASVSVAAGWHSVTPNTTYFNVGNDYSTSTGYFTAPVSGKYLISATYHSNVTTNYLYIGVLVNNVNSTPYFEGRRTVNDEYTSDNTLGGSTILNLAAGDTVRLRCYSDVAFSISGGNTRTSFSGYLLG